MNPETLELLRQNNHPRDWEKIGPEMRPREVGRIGKEPIYEFFHTFDDSLEVNTNSIAISVQPVMSFIPFHIHNYVEMTIPLLGECRVVTKNETVHVGQNDIIVIGNHTPHQVESISEGSIVVNLTLKSSAFSLNDFDFMRRTGNTQNISTMLFSLLSSEDSNENSYSLFKINHEPKIVDTLYDIIYEYYHPDGQTNQIIRFEILTLFSRLIRAASKQNMSIRTNEKVSNNLLSQLLYIEDHYADIRLEEMASYFGFNPNYLSAYLKKQTGHTFINLVQLQRINVAAEYLANTNTPIEQIALKVGYENPSYFYKVFRKGLGVSPTEYRKENSLK